MQSRFFPMDIKPKLDQYDIRQANQPSGDTDLGETRRRTVNPQPPFSMLLGAPGIG